jgi:uncharacterized protein
VRGLRGLLVLSLALLSAPAIGQEVIDTRNYIYIEASGITSGPADHASIVVSISHKGPTPQEAVDGGIKAAGDVFDTLVALGIPRQDIETNNFVFETVYIRAKEAPDYGPADPDRDTFDGYRVRNSLQVDVKDLSKIGAVLAGVARLGAEIGSVSFGASKAPDYYVKARAAAASNARAKAELYAGALGVKLGSLLAMREGSGYDPETMEYYPDDGGMADLAMPYQDMPIAPRTLNFSASVSTKWEVVPALD